MTVEQIRSLRPALSQFLAEFADCFVDADTRYHLTEYIKGQLSDLPRKSVEPIALLMDVPPRTLQEFLSLSRWDHDRLRDTAQRLVAQDHADPQAIAIVDESGHPKKGSKTACVQRQYCGASGKIDNCVMTVHLCYASFDGQFRTMIDGDLYLPEHGWADEPARRRAAGIPDGVAYRPKHQIALEQVRHALNDNGLRLGWVVADEWYGEKPAFVEGLEALGQRFVLEIPKNLMGWVRQPRDADVPRSEVQDLVRWSTPMLRQPWVDLHIKDTGMGAMVWEVRAAPFWMRRGQQLVGPYWLVAARDRLEQATVKYFLSNASAGVPLEAIVHVAFSRWPVERCIEDEKSELGLGHFECRKYTGVLRHLRITQLSHLFLARQTQRLRGKKSGGDDLPGARREQRAAGRVTAVERGRPDEAAAEGRWHHPGYAGKERRVARVSRQGAAARAPGTGHRRRDTTLLHSAAERLAL
jgi:SRSO17 transposase